MNESTPAGPGWIETLRRLGTGAAAAAQDRLDLLALEVHEEKLRLIQIVIWINVAIFTGMLAVTFVSLAAIFLFWETARVAVIVTLAVIFTGACVAVVVRLRRLLAGQPGPFAATREELARDRACIQPDN